ncbi:MAG: 3-phosphoshikimate 1-carboxyvinyltransferase 1 [Anaerolineales bacterium]|nr:3-phosphoshikimate 1-carboxyvinyltransferase 1 [Anaerolineales bacterium]
MRLIVRKSEGLRGAVRVPGDKSISHRALMLGAVAEGETRVSNWLPAGDCQATLRCLQALGVTLEQDDATTLSVQGVGRDGLRPPRKALDCQGSGTTMRLLAGILAGQAFTSTLDGHAGLRRRPMRRIIDPLRRMGADVEGRDGRFPPLQIRGGQLHGVDYHLPVASAQVKSCVLLAGLFAEEPTTVHEPGPARDHTERMLQAMGADLQIDGPAITLTPPAEPLRPLDLQVPGDLSSAAFLLVAGAIVPGARIIIEDVGGNPTRAGLLDVLKAMSAHINIEDRGTSGGEPLIDLAAQYGNLRGAEVDGAGVVRMIDEFPIFAVAATQAEGQTVVSDAQELRVKETDRIAAVATELRRMGAAIEEKPDGFVVRGPVRLKGATVNSYGDHRLAMALAVAGLVAEGETVVEGAEALGDSYPGFVKTLQELGASIANT